MIRTYLQSLRPFLQSSTTAAIRGGQKNAPVGIGIVELSSLRQAFSSSSRTPITRFTQQRINSGSRPRLATKPASYQSPLRMKNNKRSFHRSSRLRENSKPDPTKKSEPAQPLSLSARLKKLSREYGWSAVGVYFALSVLDFPFCFLLVRVVGVERIGAFEHFVVSYAKKVIPQSVRDKYNELRASWKDEDHAHASGDRAGWGVEEAEERNKSQASLGTQLALAYAIHKSFIFLRVPLTAAVTPKVVKVLRSWGWDIGKRRPKRGVSA